MKPTDVVEMMDGRYALFGLLFAFHNRLQAVGDSFYSEITCKQFFLMACMNLFTEGAPSIQEMAGIMGSSHQNVKQILNKLEKKGYVTVLPDENDKRVLRIYLTEYAMQMSGKYEEKETCFMEGLYKGITEEQARQTFAVLAKMEANLMKMREEEN